MVLPEYTYESNEGMYQNTLMQSAMSKYIPTGFGVFKKSVSFAFQDNSISHVADYLRTLQAPEDTNILTKEEYEESEHFRKEIRWTEGITEKQTEVLAERQDRMSYYGSYMKNASMLSVGGISGMIIGSIPDPINYIPFLGFSGRIAKTASLAKRIPALRMSANAMMGQTAFEAVKQGVTYKLGGDIHWEAAMIDVAIAGLIGAGAGVIFGGLGSKSGLSKEIAVSERGNNLANAGVHIGDDIPVENMGKNLDTGNLEANTPPTKDLEPDLNQTQEQIKLHQEATTTLEKEFDSGVDPANTLLQQNEGYFADALRQTKSCLLGLFGK
jgi:hypothetical protein